MLRTTLAGVRGHLVRFLLTAMAVMLGTAFVAGTFVLTDSIERTFDAIVDAGGTGTDVVVRGVEDEDGARAALPVDLLDDLRDVDGVARAEADLTGTVLLVGEDGTAVRNGGAPTLGFAYRQDDPALEIVDGRGPRSAEEVVVESSTLEASGLQVGDRTRVLVGPQPREVEVVGEARFDAGLAGATVVLVDETTARAVFAPDGLVPSFAVTAEDDVDPATLRDDVRAVLPADAEALTGEAAAAEAQEQIREALSFVNIFLLVFALIALIVGAFIIYNTFTMLVAQRTRELALLRAVGASRRQVLASVLGEALVIGLVGSGLGLALGLALARGLQALVGAFGLEISGGLPVEPLTVVATVAVGLVVTAVAATFPALRASRIAPVAAMRDDVALPERALRVRAVVGAALVLLAVAAVATGLVGETLRGQLVGVGAFLALIGAVALAPVLARPVVRVLAIPFTALGGVVGRLARENVLRNPRRTATTASALMIGLALVASVSVLSSSADASVRGLVDEELTADYVLSAGGQAPFPVAVADEVADLDGVSSVATVAGVPVRLDGAQVFAGAADPAAVLENVALDVVAGDLDDVGGDSIAVAESTAEDYGLAVGDEVRLAAGQVRDRATEVVAVYADSQLLGADALLAPDLYEEAVPASQQGVFYAYVRADPEAPADLRDQLVDIVRPFVVVSVLDPGQFTDEQAAQIDQILAILYALLGLSVVIAVLGIVNTLALSVVERTREIGLLRAVGLTRGQLRRIITVESVCTAVFGAVLGLVLGLSLGVALQRLLVDEGLERLAVPTTALVVILVLSGVVGVVAAVLPAWRAVRLDVLRAVTTE